MKKNKARVNVVVSYHRAVKVMLVRAGNQDPHQPQAQIRVAGQGLTQDQPRAPHQDHARGLGHNLDQGHDLDQDLVPQHVQVMGQAQMVQRDPEVRLDHPQGHLDLLVGQ